MTDIAEGAAEVPPFRTPTDELSSLSQSFFMSPIAAVRTHGLGLVRALQADGIEPSRALDLLAAHMAMPTGFPQIEGVGEPARIEVKGHRCHDGLVRIVGRQTEATDTLTPGGIIVEYFDMEAGRPVVQWYSDFALFGIAPTCEGELLDRLYDQASGGWGRSPQPILRRWQEMAESEDGLAGAPPYHNAGLLDRAALEFEAAVAACPLPGAWGKGLASAVVLLLLNRLLDSERRGSARQRAVRARMPRWLPEGVIDAALAWDAAERADEDAGWSRADDFDDDPVPM